MKCGKGSKYKDSLKRALNASQISNDPTVLTFTLNDVNSISSTVDEIYRISIPPDISRGLTLKCIKSDARNKSKFDCQLDVELVFAKNNINSLSSSSSSSSKKQSSSSSSRRKIN